jgi:acetyl/propionyl-CoA carboxylase alpha subunit
MEKYILVNNNKALELSAENLKEMNIVQLDEHHYHIIHNNCGISGKIINIDLNQKKVLVEINNKRHEIQIQDRLDQTIASMGLNKMNVNTDVSLKAPMPGLVLKVWVRSGDFVKKGDNLVTLEAMKMENILKANADGYIQSVHSSQGEKVNKGQLLILFASPNL